MEIKAIIFDWAKTLFDTDLKKEFPEAEDVLFYCKQKGNRIVVGSLVNSFSETNISLEERKKEIQNSPLCKYFETFLVTDKEKDIILEELVDILNLPREKILIVDDRVIRGVKYGNKNGHPTVWFQNGFFANELPNEETGIPTFTIKSLEELKNII